MIPNDVPVIPAKTIVTKMAKPDDWFGIKYNMNIYRGCTHDCIYCDSRSICYQNYDFDTIKVKENALQLLSNELRRKVKKGIISTGAMSDPYNPLEEQLKLTRSALEIMNEYNFGVSIDTKAALVTRDMDILRDIKDHSPVIVKFSITTADDELCKVIEPHVSASSERFNAIRKLSEVGIYCGILVNPILPFINDTEENIIVILKKAKESGAKFIYPEMGMAMSLRDGNREYYYKQLDVLFPGLKKEYIKRYGSQYICKSPNEKKLWSVFISYCKELGLLYDMEEITAHYRRDYDYKQLTLF